MRRKASLVFLLFCSVTTASPCSCRSTNPAKHITEPGADVVSATKDGTTQLISAAANDRIEAVKLLLVAGADQQTATLSLALQQTTAEDPLDIGKHALHRGDYIAAQEFFRAYLKDHPENVEALLLAGNASFELKQYEDAVQSFLSAIKLKPSFWPAHKNLVIVYAVQGSGRSSITSVPCCRMREKEEQLI